MQTAIALISVPVLIVFGALCRATEEQDPARDAAAVAILAALFAPYFG